MLRLTTPDRVAPLARQAWLGLLDIVWPPRCLLCGDRVVEAVCDRCRSAFRSLGTAVCARCGVPSVGALCVDCAGSRPYHFSRCRGAGYYDGPLRDAILRLKYGGKRRLAAPLGEYLAAYLTGGPFAPDRPEVIVPVPLHPSRERSRGFNQSALLAHHVGRALNLPVYPRALRRTRRTRPQAGLSRRHRAANVVGAFAAREPDAVAGRVVLLIDDVITTCHTADEAARVLVDAGARAVCVAGVARGG